MSSDSFTSSPENVWRDRYLAIQGLFYFAQGVAMGALLFFPAFLDTLLISPFERIVIQAVIWLPWYLKIAFGLLSDNLPIGRFGRRKPYVFMAGVLGIIGWVTLPMHQAFGPLVVVSGILASFGTSMSDATIDALAVDITPARRRGAMQGASWGSRGIGFGISAIAVGLLAEGGQWVIIYSVPGVVVSFSCFLILLFKENPLPPDFKRVSMSVYSSVFRQKNVLICLLFQLFAGAGIAILALMQTLLQEGLGFDQITIGIVFAFFSVGMFLGAVVFGVLGDKLSVRVTLPSLTVAYAIVILAILIMDTANTTMVTAFFCIVGVVNGGYEATQMRISMDNSPVVVSGTVYNLYNSVSNVGQLAIGAIAIAALVEVIGDYRIGWQLAIVFLVIALVVGLRLLRTQESVDTPEPGLPLAP